MADRLVLVSVELLRRVLERASSDNSCVEGEFASGPEDRAEHDRIEADIQALAGQAGIRLD